MFRFLRIAFTGILFLCVCISCRNHFTNPELIRAVALSNRILQVSDSLHQTFQAGALESVSTQLNKLLQDSLLIEVKLGISNNRSAEGFAYLAKKDSLVSYLEHSIEVSNSFIWKELPPGPAGYHYLVEEVKIATPSGEQNAYHITLARDSVPHLPFSILYKRKL